MDTSETGTAETIPKATESKWTKQVFIPPAPPASALVALPGSDQKKLYWDRSHYNSKGAQIRALHHSSTLYVGNLAFTTRTRHVQQHFAYLGPCRVRMGLDRLKKTPCGFCFVEYTERRHALAAVAHLSGTKLDGSVIRVELDAGFQPGRQYGRGASGGQVRHDRREQRNNKRSRFDADEVTGEVAERAKSDNNERVSGSDTKQDSYYGPEEGDEEGMEPNAKRQRL